MTKFGNPLFVFVFTMFEEYTSERPHYLHTPHNLALAIT